MFYIKRADRDSGKVLCQNVCGELEYLTFPSFQKTGLVKHLFTTRLGGVSGGEWASMNLSYTRGDNPENVAVNYERIGRVLGCRPEDMIASKQTHTVNIRLTGAWDRGKGIVRPADYEDVDGLITDEKGLALVTYYADCVPLYFLDPVHKAIGLAHSGWRGTAAGMGARMAEAMREHFGTRPQELLAAIGPSICSRCYEVSEDVADRFRSFLEQDKEETGQLLKEIEESGILAENGGLSPRVLTPGKEKGKYQLDLWLANLLVLRRAGIPLASIEVTDICTCHNPEYLFSHRASGGRRGNLAAFLMLTEDAQA